MAEYYALSSDVYFSISAVTQHVRCLESLHPLCFLTQLRGFAPSCLLLATQLSLQCSLSQIPYLQGQTPPGLLCVCPWNLLSSDLLLAEFSYVFAYLSPHKNIKVFIYFFSLLYARCLVQYLTCGRYSTNSC